MCELCAYTSPAHTGRDDLPPVRTEAAAAVSGGEGAAGRRPPYGDGLGQQPDRTVEGGSSHTRGWVGPSVDLRDGSSSRPEDVAEESAEPTDRRSTEPACQEPETVDRVGTAGDPSRSFVDRGVLGYTLCAYCRRMVCTCSQPPAPTDQRTSCSHSTRLPPEP